MIKLRKIVPNFPNGKKASVDLTIGKLIQLVLLAVLIALIVYGVFSGQINKLFKQVEGTYTKVLSWFHADEPSRAVLVKDVEIVVGKDSSGKDEVWKGKLTLSGDGKSCKVEFKDGQGAYQYDFVQGKFKQYFTYFEMQKIQTIGAQAKPEKYGFFRLTPFLNYWEWSLDGTYWVKAPYTYVSKGIYSGTDIKNENQDFYDAVQSVAGKDFQTAKTSIEYYGNLNSGKVLEKSDWLEIEQEFVSSNAESYNLVDIRNKLLAKKDSVLVPGYSWESRKIINGKWVIERADSLKMYLGEKGLQANFWKSNGQVVYAYNTNENLPLEYGDWFLWFNNGGTNWVKIYQGTPEMEVEVTKSKTRTRFLIDVLDALYDKINYIDGKQIFFISDSSAMKDTGNKNLIAADFSGIAYGIDMNGDIYKKVINADQTVVWQKVPGEQAYLTKEQIRRSDALKYVKNYLDSKC